MSRPTPGYVIGLENGVAVITYGTAQFAHACALMTNGGVKCWGGEEIRIVPPAFDASFSGLDASVGPAVQLVLQRAFLGHCLTVGAHPDHQSYAPHLMTLFGSAVVVFRLRHYF